jgi:hypothetical protein
MEDDPPAPAATQPAEEPDTRPHVESESKPS